MMYVSHTIQAVASIWSNGRLPHQHDQTMVAVRDRHVRTAETPPYSKAIEVRLSDWSALRRESVLAPIFGKMPILHRLLGALGLEQRRIVACPPDWRVHVTANSLVVVGFQQPQCNLE